MPKTESTQEVERRFLCRLLSVPTDCHRVEIIEQAYLTRQSPAIRLRVVNSGMRHVLTFKKHRGPAVYDEVEIDIEWDKAMILLGMSDDSVDKRRYYIDRWELDVFDGRHDGLVILEIELDRVDEELPPFPSCVGVLYEVTVDKRFSNQALALLGEEHAREFVMHALSGEMHPRLFNRDHVFDVPGLICSFCQAGMDDVAKIVAGLNVNICNKCADQVYQIVHGSES